MHIDDEIKKGLACDSVGKPESAIGRAVCLSVHPGKMLLFPFVRWFDKHYRGRYTFARLTFSIDLVLIGLLIGLSSTFLFLKLFASDITDRVVLEASVAPREVIAGAPSTLTIRLTNNTPETLRNARLSLTYPDHFLLQALVLEDETVESETIELGEIPVGAARSIHVRGVMFGDVGGEQTFTSTLNFVHGKKRDLPASKTDRYSFSPSSSTLELSLTLPDTLVAFQPMRGTITYRNHGEIDFPVISIAPEWPKGFALQSANARIVDGAFELPAITAGTEGSMDFNGYLGDVGDEVTFVFYPSFTFGSSRYAQEMLTHVAPVVPPQISVEHSIAKATAQPGAQTEFTIRYENIGEFAVSDVVLGIESESPFFSRDAYEAQPINKIEPGDSGEVVIRVPLRPSVLQSETTTYENLDLVTRTRASYTLGDGTGQRVTSKGASLTSALTSPLVLESFGRYAAATGDQLGRGPLPPRVGIETKYWIFWHIDGTTNALTNVRIEGELGDGVRFTGRQTSSQNSGVEWDEASGIVSWSASRIAPTLDPTSKLVGVAFEVGVTPTQAMVGSVPTLLTTVSATAVDDRTGALVAASGAQVTTNLPKDPMAAGLSTVKE